VTITSDGGEFVANPDWWFGHTYALETERGLDDKEDLFTPGRFVLTVVGKGSITLWAASEAEMQFDWENELQRRRAAAMPAPVNTPVIHVLTHAAMLLSAPANHPMAAPARRLSRISLVRRLGERHDDLTSWPAIGEWAFEQARQVLCVFAQYVNQGMIPNRFDDYNQRAIL